MSDGASPSFWPSNELKGQMLVLYVQTLTEAVPVGTGFVIGDDGKFVTAEHVASGLKALVDSAPGDVTQVSALNFPNVRTPLKVKKLWLNEEEGPQSDVTIGRLLVPAGAPRLPAFEVASEQLSAGETVMLVGFAGMTEHMNLDPDLQFELDAEITCAITTVSNLHPRGYNRVPGPAFEMAATIEGGMSGGPIIRLTTGQVVGLCSMAPNSPGTDPYCIGSIVRPERLAAVNWG